jgi:peptidoglycan hydrolase-like protein with peptidoglycan-binding domain
MTDRKLTAEQLIEELKRYSHREIHVHHTYIPNHSHFTGENHHDLQNGMRRFHVMSRGFADIAQHVTLFPDGTFLTGRNFAKNPASILGHNSGLPFCVEMVGNFDVGNDVFEGAQKEAMLKLAKYFRDQNKYVRFHNENSAKSCPGTSVDKTEFLREVDEFGVVVPAPKTEVKSVVVRATNSLLERGDKGEAVGDLQRKLKGFNFYAGRIDNHFGPLTEAAVEQFQRVARIGVDGIVGPQTQKALAEYQPNKSSNLPLPDGVLREGDSGEAVKQLQRALKEAKFDPGAIDGKYGPATADAVYRFQLMYRDLADDGVYGKNTRKKLAEVLK